MRTSIFPSITITILFACSLFAQAVEVYPCNRDLAPALEITTDNPLRKVMQDLADTRAPGNPETLAEVLVEFKKRILAAGLTLYCDTARATQPGRDCALTALISVEGKDFDQPRFQRNWNDYLVSRYDFVTVPAIGDLVVYSDNRFAYFAIRHFGVVREFGTDGSPRVESRFGRIPGTFLHRLDEVPTTYGNQIYYFRLKQRKS
jgi:hypothetical protein